MPTVAGRYELEGVIGAGGMGEVYRARHLQLGKTFALKVIAPAFAGDAVMRALFEREVKLASESSHPNIVSVVDYGEDPELGAFMVMELVHGDPLIDAYASAPISIRRALDILGQVADALDHVHGCGVIHGDIKADNIMLAHEPMIGAGSRRRRIARLLDFGLARRLGIDEEGVSGSPHYLAPERALGGPATIATDIYALGILGFLLFTRTLPFDGSVVDVLTAQVEQAAPSLAERRGEAVDPAIERLIARAMAKVPGERHATAAAFRYELNTVMDMLDVGPRRVRSSATQPAEADPDSAITTLFEQSPFAQALIAADGTILLANSAFEALAAIPGGPAGHGLAEAEFARAIPSLMRTIARTSTLRRSIERRVMLEPAVELVLWCGPASITDQVHLVIRTASPTMGGQRDSSEYLERG